MLRHQNVKKYNYLKESDLTFHLGGKKSSGIFSTALTMWDKIYWKSFCLLHFSSYPLYHNYSRNLQCFSPQMENSSFHTKYLIVIAIQLPKVSWFCLVWECLVGWVLCIFFFFNFIIRVQGSWFFRVFCLHFPAFLPNNHYLEPLFSGLPTHSTVLNHIKVFGSNMQVVEEKPISRQHFHWTFSRVFLTNQLLYVL